MVGSHFIVSCLLSALLVNHGFTEDTDDPTTSLFDGSDEIQNITGPIIVRKLSSKKLFNETLKAHTVHVFYLELDDSYKLDLMRIAAEVIDPILYKKETDTILEVTVSNGRDNFNMKLPVIYPNSTLYTYGKLLNPLIQEDFGSRISRKKKNSSGGQTLVVTVQSRLKVDIDYKLYITKLDSSQYNVKFKPGESSKALSLKLTFVKPIGFYLDTDEQHVKSFHLTLTSDDDICASLITVPANESIYDRPVDAEKPDNRRVLTFTKRADIFLSPTEIEMFKSFRIFVFISPDDSPCSTNSSRTIFEKNKKINVEFSKLEPSSYFLPTLAMMIFFATPALLFVPALMLNIRNSDSVVSQSNLISFSTDNPDNSSNLDATSRHEDVVVIPEEENLQVEEINRVIIREDSLSIHGEMLKYPIAIILPVLMHTAIEFHKWTTSTMANRDEMCFHNNACARPYGELRAWNNIISNIGYAIYGSVFVAITMCRRWRHHTPLVGIYESTLLDVTIGLFMVLQAIASGTYHICPSDVAFQFDTPCIQVICGLLIIRQWLVRQEAPSAAYTNILLFGVVSLNFIIAAFSKAHNVRYLIAIIHIAAIASICIMKRRTLTTRKGTFNAFVAAFAGVNFILIAIYLTSSTVHLNQIATYSFIFNCIVYLVYYSIMKLVSRERIELKGKLCGVLAILGWTAAGFFFLQDDTDWTRKAADSRALNKPCLLMNFFGSHDLWHMFGALAGLFTLLFVSFVDDDLVSTPKPLINVY